MFMDWQFIVSNGVSDFTLKATIIFTNNQIEHIKITGTGISVVLQSNRPLLDAIELKKPVSWKIIKGKLNDSKTLEKIITALQDSLEYRNINHS
jgi:hypothetical protein